MALDIQAVLISDHTGLPLFFCKTDLRTTDFDVALITSFLQATTAFDNEVFTNQTSQKSLIMDYGFSKIYFETGEYIDAVLIVKKVTEEIKNILHSILRRFQDRFCVNCFANNEDICPGCAILPQIGILYFHDFYQDLAFYPRILNWSPDWIPFIRNAKIDSIDFTPRTRVLELIDGRLTIGDLLLIYYDRDEVVCDLLVAYNNGFFDFKKTL